MRTSLVLLFISFYSFGQNDFYNFYVNEDDATAVYRKVFESNNIKKKDFINYLNSLSNITLIETDGDDLLGEIKGMIINYKKYGGTLFSIPGYLLDELSASIRIQFKDDRYRVTIKNMKFYSSSTVDVGFGITVDTDNNFSENAVNKRKGTLRQNFKKGMLFMDSHFNDIFTYKENKEDNDW